MTTFVRSASFVRHGAHSAHRTARARLRTQHLLALAFLAALICGTYYPVLIGHAALKTNLPWPSGPLFASDPMAGGPITVPLEQIATIAWSHFQLPVIDPFQGFGVPLLANQAAPVFPPELLAHLALPMNYSAWNVIRLIITGFGSYLLAVSLGQSFAASTAVGVAASLVGVAPPNVNLGMLNPLAVMPFLLLSLRYLLDPSCTRRGSAFLGVVTSTTLLALSGFQELLPLDALLIIIFATAQLIHTRQQGRLLRRTVVAVSAGSIGIFIGMIGLLPTLSAVASGEGVNSTTSYQSAVPPYWLSTFTLPGLVRGAMTGAPQDLGQSIWLLGTPVLLLIILLAVMISCRSSQRTVRWYVWPSVALVIFGLVGSVDAFSILNVFDLPIFNAIIMVRFLPFLWWIPWCLLLGVVITSARELRWHHVVASLLVSLAFDLFAFLAYHHQARMDRLLSNIAPVHALLVSIALLVGFAILVMFGRFVGTSFILLTFFTLCSLLYLPANFMTSSSNTAVSHVDGTRDLSALSTSYYVGFVQLPTQSFSVQLFGPLVTKSYRMLLQRMWPLHDAQSAVTAAAPSLFYASVTPHFVRMLSSLGTTTLVSTSNVSPALFGTVPVCGDQAEVPSSPRLCLEGVGETAGQTPASRVNVYKLLGVDGVVDPATSETAVPSRAAGLHRSLLSIAAGRGVLSSTVYVKDKEALPPLAVSVLPKRRQATPEYVTVRLHARAGGVLG